MIGALRARDHLTAIAKTARPAGGPAEARARAYCARALRNAGFDVREEPFDYSAFPGRYGTVIGGLLSTLVLVAATIVASGGATGSAIGILGLGGLALVAGGAWMVRAGVLHAPLMRRRGLNLTATRGAVRPAVWLVAHLDTKSQPIPMLVRAGAIALHGATWGIALLLCVADLIGGSLAAAWSSVGGAAVATGLPIVASIVADRSAGAVDDASGVAAVLTAAVALPREMSLGVLLTSAEELGLAGARAWVRGRPPAIALNCDGIDDDGELLLMYSGRKPLRLADAFARAAREEGKPLNVRRLLPGLLVDGVAFANAGWETITVSRGTIRTLARIHTERDDLARLTGGGIDETVPVLMRVARRLA